MPERFSLIDLASRRWPSLTSLLLLLWSQLSRDARRTLGCCLVFAVILGLLAALAVVSVLWSAINVHVGGIR